MTVQKEIQKEEKEAVEESTERQQLWENVQTIFQSYAGYRINWRSYGIPIIVIGFVSFVFAFILYSEVWIVTNNNVNTIATEIGANVNNNTFQDSVKDIGFWFGYMLLAFPLSLYLLVFWAYTTMLFNSRLAEIVKGLDEDRIKKLYELNSKEFEDIFLEEGREYNAALAHFSVGKRVYAVASPSYIRNGISKKIGRKAYRWKSNITTDLVKKISLRIDGTSISGYFFSLMLLQVIVTVSFVFPALAVGRLHVIDQDIFSPHIANNTTVANSTSNKAISNLTAAPAKSSSFLSFWTLEWAVFGVFVYSFVNLMERVPRKDVTPRYYLNTAIRYIFAIALSSLFFLVFTQGIAISGKDGSYGKLSFGALAAVAFTIGMFPNNYFRIIVSVVGRQIGGSFSQDWPLENFVGLNTNEITRLWEEGITNVDQLADCTVADLYRRTRFSPRRLRSLVGRAILWKYVFGISNFKEKSNLNGQGKELPKQEHTGDTNVGAPVRPIDINNSKKITDTLQKFSDIEALCSYLFKKPLEDIDDSDISSVKDRKTEFIDFERELGVPVEILQQVALLSGDFKERLQFTDTEAVMDELLSQEIRVEKKEKTIGR